MNIDNAISKAGNTIHIMESLIKQLHFENKRRILKNMLIEKTASNETKMRVKKQTKYERRIRLNPYIKPNKSIPTSEQLIIDQSIPSQSIIDQPILPESMMDFHRRPMEICPSAWRVRVPPQPLARHVHHFFRLDW